MSYAAIWTRSRDREVYDTALDRWTDYFDELGFRAIGLGAVVLRAASTDTRAGCAPIICRTASPPRPARTSSGCSRPKIGWPRSPPMRRCWRRAFVPRPTTSCSRRRRSRGDRYVVDVGPGAAAQRVAVPWRRRSLHRSNCSRDATAARSLGRASRTKLRPPPASDHASILDRLRRHRAASHRLRVSWFHQAASPASGSSPDRLEGSVP